ncbi:flagella synthesis chaperone protein FlgN [Litchfieldella qijiaojingensis]|uniref:Flagella synthesis chaperone protein FlgN n=1 Tax=Litchfieldella qijiaojingensis TaxID=980347 RepID=A0ABQ2YD32_9GAMM|nr:flagellar protein FlgN [Halomonas qijiaojingensis]GGX77924.1 flagella synthesis chaperone protein FlgN [Halomonas qijiaojingensis]
MSLGQHLERQRQCLDDLAALLIDERHSLSAAKVDGQQLNEIASRKQALLDDLDRLDTQRRAAQHKLGYAKGHPGAEQAARDAGCLETWHAMREQAEHVSQLNELNGSLVQMRLSHNQRILNFLHEAAGKSLYGPNGQSDRRGLSGLASQA